MSLSTEFKQLVHAGFSGIWVETHECDSAIDEMREIANSRGWGFDVWDIDRQLYSRTFPAPGPVQALRVMEQPLPNEVNVLVLKNFHKFMANPEVLQVLANRVVAGKGEHKHIVVVSPTVQLPPEVEKLFTVLHHELPNDEQLKEICTGLFADGGAEGCATPSDSDVQRVVEAARGLTRQEAENAFALSLVQHQRLQQETIWSIKGQTLEKSGTLSLYRGDASFGNLGGLDNLKDFCLRAMRRQGETSADRRPKGVLLLSPPGCGKSQFAKALGNEVGRPTVMLDFGSLMGKFVGESEGNMRRALKQIDAMAPCVLFVDEIEKGLAGVQSSGETDSGVSARLFGNLLTWLNDHTSDVFFIGTCNDASQLPAPFARAERFDGVFFVDLPSAEQRQAIWNIYLNHFGIDGGQDLPDDTNWTGAEIKSCCRLAALLDVPLVDAALNVVPVAVTASEQIERLRSWAEGRCLSADSKGLYTRVGKAHSGAGKRRVVNTSNN